MARSMLLDVTTNFTIILFLSMTVCQRRAMVRNRLLGAIIFEPGYTRAMVRNRLHGVIKFRLSYGTASSRWHYSSNNTRELWQEIGALLRLNSCAPRKRNCWHLVSPKRHFADIMDKDIFAGDVTRLFVMPRSGLKTYFSGHGPGHLYWSFPRSWLSTFFRGSRDIFSRVPPFPFSLPSHHFVIWHDRKKNICWHDHKMSFEITNKYVWYLFTLTTKCLLARPFAGVSPSAACSC